MNTEKIEFLKGKFKLEIAAMQQTKELLLQALLEDKPDLETALFRIAEHMGEVYTVKYHYDHTKERIEKYGLSKLCNASLVESRRYVEKLVYRR